MKKSKYITLPICVLFVVCIFCACIPVPEINTLSLVGSWESACNHPENEKKFLTFSDDGTILIEIFKHETLLYEIYGTYTLVDEQEIKYNLDDELFGAQNGTWLYLIDGENLYLSDYGTTINTQALEETEEYYIRTVIE